MMRKFLVLLLLAALSYSVYWNRRLYSESEERQGKVQGLELELERFRTRIAGEKQREEKLITQVRAELSTQTSALNDAELRLNQATNQSDVRRDLPLLQAKRQEKKAWIQELQRRLKLSQTELTRTWADQKLLSATRKQDKKFSDSEWRTVVQEHEQTARSLSSQIQVLKNQKFDANARIRSKELEVQLQQEKSQIQELKNKRELNQGSEASDLERSQAGTQMEQSALKNAQSNLSEQIKQEQALEQSMAEDIRIAQSSQADKKKEIQNLRESVQAIRSKIVQTNSRLAGYESHQEALSK